MAKYGIPTLAGPFFLSALLFGLGTLLLLVFLRPDPATVARRELGKSVSAKDRNSVGMRTALGVVWSEPRARLGVSAMAVGHIVMVPGGGYRMTADNSEHAHILPTS